MSAKDKDWTGKMKPSEYKKVCEYLRCNGFEEVSLEYQDRKGGPVYNKGISNFTQKKEYLDGVKSFLRIASVGSKFIDTNVRYLYVDVDYVIFRTNRDGRIHKCEAAKSVSTLEELIAFIDRVHKAIELFEYMNL